MNAAANTLILSADEERDLFAVYLGIPGMHHLPFHRAIQTPALLGCLRNTLEAKRRRLAKAKAKAAQESSGFVLT